MRKEYDFSKGRQNVYAKRLIAANQESADDLPPLTRPQIRELRRRVEDFKDRTRYLLVSEMTPRFALYYNVSEDTYGMNEPRHATLFKRRRTAVAIRKLLGGRVNIVRCRVNARGELVLNSLPQRLTRRRRPRRKGAV